MIQNDPIKSVKNDYFIKLFFTLFLYAIKENTFFFTIEDIKKIIQPYVNFIKMKNNYTKQKTTYFINLFCSFINVFDFVEF